MRKTAKKAKTRTAKTSKKATATKKKPARKASRAAPATKAASKAAGLNILFSPLLAGPLRKMARAQGIPAKKLAFNIVASAVAPMTATI